MAIFPIDSYLVRVKVASHSSITAGRIPCTVETGRLQSTVSQRLERDRANEQTSSKRKLKCLLIAVTPIFNLSTQVVLSKGAILCHEYKAQAWCADTETSLDEKQEIRSGKGISGTTQMRTRSLTEENYSYWVLMGLNEEAATQPGV